MKKRTIIIVIIAIILIFIASVILFLHKNNKSNTQVNTTRIYDENGQVVADFSKANEITETKENISIQGIVELHHNGYIYIFNGQHFGEFGFESGDLYIKGYGENNFDTKDNSIIVLKSKDYAEMKKEVLNGNSKYSSLVTIEESYADLGYVYLKYALEDDIHSDTGYNFPFGIKAHITENTNISGSLQKGKSVEVQYEDLIEPFNELNLKSIKVVEK